MSDELNRLTELFSRALWIWLPTWAKIALRLSWPVIKTHVIPALIQLFGLESHAGLTAGNAAAVRTYEQAETIALGAPTGLKAALIRARFEMDRDAFR